MSDVVSFESRRPACVLCGCRGPHNGPPSGRHCELLKTRRGQLQMETCGCPIYKSPRPMVTPRPMTIRRRTVRR